MGKKKKAKSKEILVVGSKVKAYIKEQGLKCSGELIPALSDEVAAVIDKAIARAGANNHTTVKPRDL